MTDEDIIELYFARDEEAIRQTKLKYNSICCHIANNILSSKEDSEECVNEAFLGLWNAIPPQRPLSLKAFACKIVRNISMKRVRYNLAQKRSSDNTVSFSELERVIPSEVFERVIDENELARALNGFLGSLAPEARKVFVRRYWYFDPINEIMKRYSYSESKVNNILYRTRNKLREYLKKEGIDI